MKRLKLRPFVLPSVYVAVVLAIIITIMATANTYSPKEEDEQTYVTGGITNDTIPVINEAVKVIKPFHTEGVAENVKYYDYQAEASSQQSSLIKYENTYMQNSGVDFVYSEPFEVISILEGEVIDIQEDELLGQVVHVKHDNDLISVYQSLGEVIVQKGEKVSQSQKIGLSGTNKLDSSNQYHLHFELYEKGNIVNPTSYFDKEITINE